MATKELLALTMEQRHKLLTGYWPCLCTQQQAFLVELAEVLSTPKHEESPAADEALPEHNGD